MIFKTAMATLRISTSACSLPRSSMKCRSARALPVKKIFVSVAFGSTERAACRAIFRRRVFSGTSVKRASRPFTSSSYACRAAFTAVLHTSCTPVRVGVYWWGVALAHVALGKLQKREVPVPDQLVRERARHAGHDETPNPMLEHAAVAHLEQVADELAVRFPALPVAHVADAAGHLGEALGTHLGVG